MDNVYGWAKVFVSEIVRKNQKQIEIYGEDILSGDVEFAGTLTREIDEDGDYLSLTKLEWEILSVVDNETLINALLVAIANQYRSMSVYQFEMVNVPLCVSHRTPLKFEFNGKDYTYTFHSSE